jgi:hypothetical protein
MDWFKRNLVLVVVAAVALGLLGFGGYSLYNKYQQDAEITGTLQAELDSFKTYTEKDPHPDDDNIKAAKNNQKQIAEFLASARKSFAQVSIPADLDNASFRNLLDNTVSDLRRDADKYGVSLTSLPPKYGFTFAAQLQSVQYTPNTLEPLATQLAEIRSLVEILYRANVHGLLGLRRVTVSPTEETFGSADYLVGKKIGTDAETGAIVTPYEIAFQCFSTELAGVLEGLYRSPYGFVVRNLVVDKTLSPLMAEGEGEGTPGTDGGLAARYGFVQPQAGVTPGMDPAMAARYGLNRGGGADAQMMRRYGGGKQDGPGGGGMDAAMASRYGLRGPRNPYGGGAAGAPTPPPAPVAPPVAGVMPPPTRPGLSTVLDESPLRVTLQIDSIRFPNPAEAKPQKPARQ